MKDVYQAACQWCFFQKTEILMTNEYILFCRACIKTSFSKWAVENFKIFDSVNIIKQQTCKHDNPLTPTVTQKLLEIIGRVRLCPSCSFATALDSDINQTTGSGGHLSMWENRCMHAAVCLLRASQPRSAGDTAKLGQFIGQFSWVTDDPIGVEGLNMQTRAKYTFRIQIIKFVNANYLVNETYFVVVHPQLLHTVQTADNFRLEDEIKFFIKLIQQKLYYQRKLHSVWTINNNLVWRHCH